MEAAYVAHMTHRWHPIFVRLVAGSMCVVEDCARRVSASGWSSLAS